MRKLLVLGMVVFGATAAAAQETADYADFFAGICGVNKKLSVLPGCESWQPWRLSSDNKRLVTSGVLCNQKHTGPLDPGETVCCSTPLKDPNSNKYSACWAWKPIAP